MTSYFKSYFAKAETPASLWAKDNIPGVMIKKSPLGLSTEPKVTKTKIPVFDGIMGPGVAISGAVAGMNNAIIHFNENIKAFGAMANGAPSIDKVVVAGQDVRIGHLYQFGVFNSEGTMVATMDCVDKLKIVDSSGWAALTSSVKPQKFGSVETLCENLAAWLVFIDAAQKDQAQFAAEQAKIVLDPVKMFPQLIATSEDPELQPDPDAPTGIVNERAPWVTKDITYQIRKYLPAFCVGKNKVVQRAVALDELLKRKKARTRSGRKAQRRSARRTVKMLKKEEKDALEIYNDKEKLRKVFDENDKDKSGTLDFDELKELFKKVKMPKDDIEIEEMIEAADADGSGTIEFEEFANVQKKVAEDKRAQWKEWYKDPLLRTTRRFGCTLKDRKRFYKLSYVDADGNEVYGQKKEKKLLKELMAEQKKNDDVVKDWSKIIMDGVTKANLVLVGLRKLFIDSATETMSVSKVFAMVRAKLMDFAIIIGKNMVTSGDLLPALKLSKDFKLLFQGKNPITGVDIIAPDGGCINFDLNKGLEVPLKGLNATMRFIYQTFFQFEHPANLVCIFKTLAVKVKQLCTNAVKLGVRVANFAMKCLPPFPIVGLIQNQVMRICMKSAMSLDFKIRKTPGTIVSNVRKFGGFPSASLKFARGCKGMFKTFLAMAPKDGPKAIGQADEPEDENDEVDPNELGDDFKKGAGRASGAAGAASEANSAQGEFQKKGLSKQDQKEEKFASEKTDAEDDEDDESPKKSQVAAAPGVNLSDAALESKFAEIDADGDGTLTKSEMEIALRSDEYSFTDEQVAQMLKAADLDDNNSIDIDEFKEAMRSLNE